MADVTPIFDQEDFGLLKGDGSPRPKGWRSKNLEIFCEYLIKKHNLYSHIPRHVAHSGQSRLVEDPTRFLVLAPRPI